MHDPKTVICDFPPYSWRERLKFLPHLFTLWHVDPEADGSDDSCGYSVPKLTRKQLCDLDWLAGCEARTPWFQRETAKEPASPADAEALLRGAFLSVAPYVGVRNLTMAEATEWACGMLHHPADNVRSSLCLLPGWHTNSERVTEDDRKREAAHLFYIVARFILRERRPWWRHPRWHVRHWEIQIRPLQTLKRVLFSRCRHCGGRFSWHDCQRGQIIGYSWHSEGPQWFRNAENIAHMACDQQHVLKQRGA